MHAPADAQPLPTEPARPLLDQEVRRLAVRVLRLRVWVAPLVALLATCVALLDPQPWRVAMMAAVGTTAVVGAAASSWWARRHGVTQAAIRMNVTVMWGLQLAMIAGSGGLDSPLLPILVPLGFVTGFLERRRGAVLAVVGLQAAGVLALAAGQTLGWVPALTLPSLSSAAAPLRPVPTLWLEAGVLVLVLSGASSVAVFMRHTVERVLHQAVTARADQLSTLEASSRDLQILGAEIAHELKNPLASIKGLSTLLARDTPEGRSAERLTVLRAEVERMQVTLEEFLTFSRPLAPLSLASVHLPTLARELADLHEGVAAARGVALRVGGDAPDVRADARKLVQVLMNLLQNALDASPRGSTVRLQVASEPEHVTVSVEDQGPGLPTDLGERVFEAGVTGKPDGSGLGLTVARAIARQHDGTLTLVSPAGGGTRAQLTLPRAGPGERLA